MNKKLGFIFLLAAFLLPWEHFSSTDYYTTAGTLNDILMRSPKNVFLLFWMLVFGIPDLVSYCRKIGIRNLVIVLVFSLIYTLNTEGIVMRFKFLFWLEMAFYSRHFWNLENNVKNLLKLKLTITVLLLPWLYALPFSGLNENPNRLGRDAALYAKYSTLMQAVILLVLVILSQSRGAILFLMTLALSRFGFLKSRIVGLMIVISCLISPVLFINSGEFLFIDGIIM